MTAIETTHKHRQTRVLDDAEIDAVNGGSVADVVHDAAWSVGNWKLLGSPFDGAFDTLPGVGSWT